MPTELSVGEATAAAKQGQDGWNQEWRVGLRNAIDWLRDAFDAVFEREIKAYHKNPWGVRNAYINIINNRSTENIERFFKEHFGKTFSEKETTHIIRLLEMQKQSLYMQTSCGWFFNELSGIETIQILQYANRGIQLAEDESDAKIESEFLAKLATAHSNLPEFGTGAEIYKKHVAPKRLSLTQVGMHYAVSSLIEEENREVTILNYDCEGEKSSHKKAGTYILSVGSTRVRSRVTLSYKRFHYAILYLGNHHLVGSTSNKLTEAEFDSIVEQIEISFDQGNIAECLDIIKWNFQDRSFSFFNLFKDEQLKLLNRLTVEYEQMALDSYNKIYEQSYSLLNLMRAEKHIIPSMLQKNLENVFQFKLEEMLNPDNDKFSMTRFQRYAVEVIKWNAQLDEERIKFHATQFTSRSMANFSTFENKTQWIARANTFLETLYSINIYPDINELQDFIFRLVKENNLSKELRKAILKLAVMINLQLDAEDKSAGKKELT